MDIIIEAIEQAGFSPLPSNEEDAGAFEAEGLRFGWEARDGEAVFYTSLGVLPQHPSTELCERLLEADCLGIGTGGGHIGLYGPTRTLLYSFRTRIDGADVPRRPSSGRRRNSAPLSPTRAHCLSRARCSGFDVCGHSLSARMRRSVHAGGPDNVRPARAISSADQRVRFGLG